MDNTPQEQMQEERLNRIESVNRNTGVEENLQRFKVSQPSFSVFLYFIIWSLLMLEDTAYTQTMLEGVKEYCLRARIDMSSVNGTMRDPVLYRANPTPHHRYVCR